MDSANKQTKTGQTERDRNNQHTETVHKDRKRLGQQTDGDWACRRAEKIITNRYRQGETGLKVPTDEGRASRQVITGQTNIKRQGKIT